MNVEYVRCSQRFVRANHPDAVLAFLGGSAATGLATEQSDLDILIVLPDECDGVSFVETSTFEGRLVEAFVYGRGQLKEWQRRGRAEYRPVLDRLIGEGIPLIPGIDAEELAMSSRQALSAGSLCPAAELQARRYALSAAVDDLQATTESGERYVLMATVWREAAELGLLADGRWIGTGKWLLREVRAQEDPFGLAAWAADSGSESDALRECCFKVLDSVGGYLQDGFLRGVNRKHPTRARLIVVSGLPGVGKTSVAARLAERLGGVHLSIDVIEEAVLGSGVPRSREVGVSAYEVARAVAQLNLPLGRDVVVDAVNDSQEARQTWRNAAHANGSHLTFVHLVVSDDDEHRRRLTERDRGFAHICEPEWDDVRRRRETFAPWTDPQVEIDTTARSADEVADAVIHQAARSGVLMTTTTAEFWHDARYPQIESRRSCRENSCYRPHTHDRFSIGLIDSGTSVFTDASNGAIVLEPGDVIVIPAGHVHSCNPDHGRWRYQMTHVDKDWLNVPLPEQIEVHRDPDLYHRFDAANALLFDRCDGLGAVREALREALARCIEAPHRRIRADTDDALARQLGRVFDALRGTGDDPRLDDLAGIAGMSRYQVLRAVKRSTGLTPNAWRNNERVLRGRVMLRDGRPIADVAHELGFADQSHFHRVFRSHVAATPGAYRS